MTRPFAHMDITEVFCDVDDLCKSFAAVKFIFEWGLKHETFDFSKVREYRKMLQLT